jgi:hypothetical protein
MQNRPSAVSRESVETNLIPSTLMIHGVDFQYYAISWELAAGAGRIYFFLGHLRKEEQKQRRIKALEPASISFRCFYQGYNIRQSLTRGD